MRLYLSDRAQRVQNFTDRDLGAAGDIIGMAALALFEQEGVGPDDVADVGKVAPLVEIADAHDGISALSDGRELGSKRRRDKLSGLAGPDMIGGPGHHDIEAVVVGI